MRAAAAHAAMCRSIKGADCTLTMNWVPTLPARFKRSQSMSIVAHKGDPAGQPYVLPDIGHGSRASSHESTTTHAVGKEAERDRVHMAKNQKKLDNHKKGLSVHDDDTLAKTHDDALARNKQTIDEEHDKSEEQQAKEDAVKMAALAADIETRKKKAADKKRKAHEEAQKKHKEALATAAKTREAIYQKHLNLIFARLKYMHNTHVIMEANWKTLSEKHKHMQQHWEELSKECCGLVAAGCTDWKAKITEKIDKSRHLPVYTALYKQWIEQISNGEAPTIPHKQHISEMRSADERPPPPSDEGGGDASPSALVPAPGHGEAHEEYDGGSHVALNDEHAEHDAGGAGGQDGPPEHDPEDHEGPGTMTVVSQSEVCASSPYLV